VACHVNFPPSITNALEAGVDSIEHGCLVTDEELDQMRELGTFWVVTSRIYWEQFQDFKAQAAHPATPWLRREWAEKQVRRHEWIWENMPRAVCRARDLGVRLVAGSDMIYPEPGIASLPLELASLVEIGLAPAEALRACTLTAAECLGCEDELGTVEEGKLADLIAVAGDPLSDVGALQDVPWVMKAGRVEKDDLSRF
jgi:imidazolonepropionase-like amidohydrolase